jgi:large subunit ribosomal protein L30
MTENPLFAALMVKGRVKINRKVVDTLKSLRLSAPNTCVVVPADDMHGGMLKKVSEYVTWGRITQETLEKILVKRGGMDTKKAKSAASGAFRNGKLEGGHVFRLSPPSGGLKAVRLHYPLGDVGYRGDGINSLLARMI